MHKYQTQSGNNLSSNCDDTNIILLAKDPYCLYAYWEVSEDQKNVFVNEFGNELWNKSTPVLRVTNVQNNTSFYKEINDDSNSWYINVPCSNCLYVVELGRRVSEHFFISLSSSNYVVTPNDNISANTTAYFVNHKDLQNGWLNVTTSAIYNTYNLKTGYHGICGLSSPELLDISFNKNILGVSSAELYGVSLQEYIGISSGSFIR